MFTQRVGVFCLPFSINSRGRALDRPETLESIVNRSYLDLASRGERRSVLDPHRDEQRWVRDAPENDPRLTITRSLRAPVPLYRAAGVLTTSIDILESYKDCTCF
ncbi:MAG: hypothetical protein P4L85_29425 [Paludisphaera borealis]|uniref:hypothetical protein n=1 Tax=Paludisphaera borealis TaxID=1387353 RepID=UPI00284A7998|nr:hypothetical protein [Paludisphaera borealis]MDR3623490.1 hypothetical protein [Paludisphaera borealis]